MKRWMIVLFILLAGCGGASQSPSAPASNTPTTDPNVFKAELSNSDPQNPTMLDPARSCTSYAGGLPLRWNEPPKGTQSFAVVMRGKREAKEDFVYWVFYNLKGDQRSTNSAVTDPNGFGYYIGTHGKNGFGTSEFLAPCPKPTDEPLPVSITVYALDLAPTIKESLTLPDLESTIKDHIVAQSVFTAFFMPHPQ